MSNVLRVWLAAGLELPYAVLRGIEASPPARLRRFLIDCHMEADVSALTRIVDRALAGT